jgi:DNA-binding protein H-NS
MADHNTGKLSEKLGLTLSSLNSSDCLRLIGELLGVLTPGDLQQARDLAEQMRQERLAANKDELIEAMRRRLDGMGIDAGEIGLRIGKKKRKTRRTAPPKYQGPNGETWSGRGTVPAWIRELEEAGENRETYRVYE